MKLIYDHVHIKLAKSNLPGLSLEQMEKLLKLRSAIMRSEALYKERHLNIYEVDPDSDEDLDEDQIYSYYFNDDQDENDDKSVTANEDTSESDTVIYDIPKSSDYARYVVDQMLYGRLRDRVELFPDGVVKIVLSEQCSATV